MFDRDEEQLKDEIDQIMKRVDGIMQKIEDVNPLQNSNPDNREEWHNLLTFFNFLLDKKKRI